MVEMKFPSFVTFYEKHKLIVFSDGMIKCKISPIKAFALNMQM